MNSLRHFYKIIIPAILMAVIVVACQKDAPTATTTDQQSKLVTGILRDEQGYVIPNAVVEAINSANSSIAIDTSDEFGAFSLEKLPSNIDDLQMRVSHGDFKPFLRRLRDAISEAGDRQGIILHLLHGDSCCGRLVVNISNNSTGAAISGAEVRLRRNGTLVTTVTSDSTGIVAFNHLCGGEYNLRIARDGFTVVERGAVVEHCDSSSLDIRMVPSSNGGDHPDSCCQGSLRIIPRDSATNAVISGASVRITGPNGVARTATSNGDGVTFHEICNGQYNVRIAKDGYHVVEFAVTAHCSDSIVTTRTMAPTSTQNNQDSCCGGRLTIVPRDSATNALITGATVTLWRGGAQVGTRTISSAGAVFEHLCQGTYGVSISREHYHGIEFSVTLECNGTAEIARRMLAETSGQDTCCNGVIRVAVADSTSGAAIAGASVRLWSGNTLLSTLTSNGDGVVRFTGLCAGTYSLSMSKDGYSGREFSVTIGCNGVSETTRRMLSTQTHDTCCDASLALRVKDSTVADGGWLSGVTVTIVKNGTTLATGTTNGDGGYTRNELCGNSTYTVTFSKDGYNSKTVTFTYTTCRAATETIRLTPH